MVVIARFHLVSAWSEIEKKVIFNQIEYFYYTYKIITDIISQVIHVNWSNNKKNCIIWQWFETNNMIIVLVVNLFTHDNKLYQFIWQLLFVPFYIYVLTSDSLDFCYARHKFSIPAYIYWWLLKKYV